ncbi:hypothetical protein BaRGS_00035976, partial [Batillaria attramentaria]
CPAAVASNISRHLIEPRSASSYRAISSRVIRSVRRGLVGCGLVRCSTGEGDGGERDMLANTDKRDDTTKMKIDFWAQLSVSQSSAAFQSP